jgi:hypothetical protein
MIKTFRGLLASGGLDTIRLSTNDGLTGYKIVKFEVIQEQPGVQDTESTITVSKETFTPANAINFTNPLILAVAYFSGTGASAYPQVQNHIIFDREVFNQDIFVGSFDNSGKAMNYYIELEQVKLDLSEATVATLKDMRAN